MPRMRSTAGFEYVWTLSASLAHTHSSVVSTKARNLASLSRMAASARFRSVTSWPMADRPTTSPAESRMGEYVNATWTSRPSSWWRTVSSLTTRASWTTWSTSESVSSWYSSGMSSVIGSPITSSAV